MGCLAALALLPWGLLTWFHSSGIRQIDPRYPVLGFKVSRGRNRTLSVRREVCRIGGLTLSRAVEASGRAQPLRSAGSGARSPAFWATNPTAPGDGMPARFAGWMRKLGLKPQLETGTYTSSVYLSDESCAIIVRFAHNRELGGYDDIGAFLVDDQGGTIPLTPYRDEFPAQSGEYVRFWVVSPAPVTRAKFDLRLRLAGEGKDIAVLRLGGL